MLTDAAQHGKRTSKCVVVVVPSRGPDVAYGFPLHLLRLPCTNNCFDSGGFSPNSVLLGVLNAF